MPVAILEMSNVSAFAYASTHEVNAMPEYWLWVTNRETIYASDLENHKDEAWTCDERTKDGDLILLYCNSKGMGRKGIS